MEVNFSYLLISEIVTAKLNQMDCDGIIQKKIEETLEKTVLDAITSELGSYSFKRSISEQVSKSISDVAANCGFSAYNGFNQTGQRFPLRERALELFVNPLVAGG